MTANFRQIKFFFRPYTEAATKKTAPCQNKWLLTGSLIFFMSCALFLDEECLFFASKVFVLETIVEPCFEILSRDVFFLFCRLPFSIFIMHSPETKDERFWRTLKKLIFPLLGKKFENLESKKILCIHRPKILNASSVHRHKIFTEGIQCLCSNVVAPLFVATSQSTNNRCMQTLRLDTNELVLTRDTTVH